MFAGIGAIRTRAQHRNRAPTGAQRPCVRRTINATGQAASNNQPRTTQVSGKITGIGQSRVRRVPAADNRQLRQPKQRRLTAQEQQWRGVRNFTQQGGIVCRIQGQNMLADALAPGHVGRHPFIQLAL